jgi:hypothetical protein
MTDSRTPTSHGNEAHSTAYEPADATIIKSTTTNLVGVVLQAFIAKGGTVGFRSDSAVCDASNPNHAAELAAVASWGMDENNIICNSGFASLDTNTLMITGVSATGAVGTLSASSTASAVATLTGVSATGGLGDVSSFVAGDTTAGLSGVSGTGSIGSFGVEIQQDGTVVFTGVSGSGDIGTLVATSAAEPTTASIYGTNDESIEVVNGTWTTARNSTTGTVNSDSNDQVFGILSVYDHDGPVYVIHRSFVEFGIPAGTSVTSATIALDVHYVEAGGTVYVQQGTQSASLTSSDFDNFTGAVVGSLNVTSTGQKTITLNSTGLSYLSSVMGGTAKFCLRADKDYSNSVPTDIDTDTAWRASEYAGTASDPRLDITYE